MLLASSSTGFLASHWMPTRTTWPLHPEIPWHSCKHRQLQHAGSLYSLFPFHLMLPKWNLLNIHEEKNQIFKKIQKCRFLPFCPQTLRAGLVPCASQRSASPIFHHKAAILCPSNSLPKFHSSTQKYTLSKHYVPSTNLALEDTKINNSESSLLLRHLPSSGECCVNTHVPKYAHSCIHMNMHTTR